MAAAGVISSPFLCHLSYSVDLILPLHWQLIHVMEFAANLSVYADKSCCLFLIFIWKFLVPNFTCLVL